MSGPFQALSRLPIRLLAFNILLVFLPAAGVLFLGTYESHLLDAQERTMAQEGRLLAAALEASGDLEARYAEKILVQLGQRHLARLRVVDERGAVMADSAALGPRLEGGGQPSTSAARSSPQESVLYRLASLPVRLARTVLSRPGGVEPRTGEEAGVLSGPAVQRIVESPLEEVVVSNSIPLTEEAQASGKIKTVSIARLLGEAIRRIHNSDSVSSLFV